MSDNAIKRVIAKNGAHGRANRSDPNAPILFSVAPGMALTYTHETNTHVLARGDVEAWVSKADIGLSLPPQPPPTPKPATGRLQHNPSARYQLGISVLNDAKTAFDLARRGCRSFLIMDNPIAAQQLKQQYPDAAVMQRFYTRQFLSASDFVAAHRISRDTKHIILGFNEGDSIGYGTGDEIRRRAERDIEIAMRVREIAPDAIYSGGGFSTGTPDITSPAICDAIRSCYASAVNGGLMTLNFHLYSKRDNGQYIGAEWFETRFNWLYANCGINRDVVFTCDETGVEPFGFAGQNMNAQQVGAWCERWLNLQRSARGLHSAAIFATEWRTDPRYNIMQYMPVFERFWNS